jgi:hypothetical protein
MPIESSYRFERAERRFEQPRAREVRAIMWISIRIVSHVSIEPTLGPSLAF